MVLTALLRLAFVPFAGSSYIMGVTSIKTRDYVIGGCSYILNVVMQVFIGSSLYNVSSDKPDHEEKHQTQKVMFIVELVITIIVSIIMGLYAKRIARKKLEEYENIKEDNQI